MGNSTDKLLHPGVSTPGPSQVLQGRTSACVQPKWFTGTKEEAIWDPPRHTVLSHAAICPMAPAAHTACGEGQAVKLGLGEEPGEAIRLRREAGERLAGW